MTSSVRRRELRLQALVGFALLHGRGVNGFTSPVALSGTPVWPTSRCSFHRSSLIGRWTQSRDTAVKAGLHPKRGRQGHRTSALRAAQLSAQAARCQAALASLLFGFREANRKIWSLAAWGFCYLGLYTWALYLLIEWSAKVRPQHLKVVYEGLSKTSRFAEEFALKLLWVPLGMAFWMCRFIFGNIPATILNILFPKSHIAAIFQDALKRIPNAPSVLVNRFIRIFLAVNPRATFFLLTVVFAPIHEELVYRQILSLVLAAPSSWVIMRYKPWVLLSSLLFGLSHAANLMVPLPQDVDWQHPQQHQATLKACDPRLCLGNKCIPRFALDTRTCV